jgi:hypothetical protein
MMPSHSVALVYILFFGHYPMTKSLAERTHRKIFEWLIKLGIFNAAVTAAVLLFSALLYDLTGRTLLLPVLYLVGNVAFVIYDMAFSGLIDMYLKRFPLNNPKR